MAGADERIETIYSQEWRSGVEAAMIHEKT
jgi:hypothetical protein